MNTHLLTGVIVIGLLSAAHAEVRYTVTDLGLPPGSSQIDAFAINAIGQVVGTSRVADLSRGFFYDSGAIRDLGDPPAGSFVDARGINLAGAVVGFYGTQRAFVYDGTSFLDLGTLGGAHSAAYGIN